jgi:Ca2+:H+ antiporter
MRGIRWLLLFFPVALAAEFLHWGDLVIFVTAALAIIPFAGILGEATEALAAKTGPQVGGLLNASLGNAAELIITLVAIRAGSIELVRASIIGSILGNLLLVLGFSLLLGGIKHGVQRFDRSRVTVDATLTILAAIAISIPSFFSQAIEPDFWRVEYLSLTTAAVVLLLYILSIVYTLRLPKKEVEHGVGEAIAHAAPHWSTSRALMIMAAAVAGLAVMSEFLVGSLDAVSESFGLSEFFVGIILVPLIGNVAEHLVAVQVALKNQMDLSLSIALGSSLQIALFVALDGRSNWLEGAMLIAVYGILALGFYFLPATIH